MYYLYMSALIGQYHLRVLLKKDTWSRTCVTGFPLRCFSVEFGSGVGNGKVLKPRLRTPNFTRGSFLFTPLLPLGQTRLTPFSKVLHGPRLLGMRKKLLRVYHQVASFPSSTMNGALCHGMAEWLHD